MPALDEHPTVRSRRVTPLPVAAPMSAAELRQLALDCGADDAGVVSLDRPELADQRDDILRAFPHTRSLLAIVCRMNREPIRTPYRSASNLEFHRTTHHVNDVTQAIVRTLENRGIRALNASAGFPMEMGQFPGKVWFVSHKPVAVAAGLGQMGIHRNVIHPKFGNFILLGTVLIDQSTDVESRPIDYNPCLSCKLCVSACPVGAIKPDGKFDASSCMTHNYREFMSGFTDWVETVADSRDAKDYRSKVNDSETASIWQSLSFGANYKAAYCLSVCPAGEDVIGPFLADKKSFIDEQVKPLQQKVEPVYVVKGSDAEEHVAKRFPHKTIRRIHGVRPTSIDNFLSTMFIAFQSGQAKGLDATYHFTFTGDEPRTATIIIRNQTLDVSAGHHGTPDCAVTADSAAWMAFLRRDTSIVWQIVRRKIRVKGKIALLKAFGKCFPS
jgi:NAD-dependent dihydropyrimidine dehydrogenase PreA subunit